MASPPTASFEHVWGKLMRALGRDHPTQVARNRAILQDVKQLMGGK